MVDLCARCHRLLGNSRYWYEGSYYHPACIPPTNVAAPQARIAALEAQLAALPEPDMVSMSEGTIHLDYEDDDARREAYEWLERYAYSSAPKAHQEPVACFTKCATEGCDNPATNEFIRGDVGSFYCGDCFGKVIAVCEVRPAPEAQQERPAEQAVTEAMVEAALNGADYIPNPDNRAWMRNALKAAMEAGR